MDHTEEKKIKCIDIFKPNDRHRWSIETSYPSEACYTYNGFHIELNILAHRQIHQIFHSNHFDEHIQHRIMMNYKIKCGNDFVRRQTHNSKSPSETKSDLYIALNPIIKRMKEAV